MPLFVTLSGYLFAFLYYGKKKSYCCIKSIAYNKLHRLVIPFFVLGSISTLAVPERPFLKGMFWGDGSSLWFCMMLFWCIMLRSIVLKMNSRVAKFLLLTFSLLMIGCFHSNYNVPYMRLNIPVGALCFSRAIYFYAYFVLGDVLYSKRLFFALCGRGKLVSIALLYVVTWTLGLLFDGTVVETAKSFLPALYSIMLFAITIRLVERKKLIENPWLNSFGKYSFGVYVFHEPIAWNCYHWAPLLDTFRGYPLLFPLVFTVVVFILCYVGTILCFKTSIGRYLLS